MEPIAVDLSGVPETLLWNLGRRAAAARAGNPLLDDPRAIEVADRLQYDFGRAARGAGWHAVRVATFDQAVRRFLRSHPDGTVVALGEGLETQFWRVDNGRVRWLSVDLPDTLDLRRRVLPDGPRQRSHPGSALDLGWAELIDPAGPVLVTAQGLLVYFTQAEVHELIAAMAARLPGARFVFDVVPRPMQEMARRAAASAARSAPAAGDASDASASRERDQAIELWQWLFDRRERAAISRIPGVARVQDLRPPRARGIAPAAFLAVRLLPPRARYALPVLPVLEVTFR
jgi:O-methyltransferase involved in polyketide biosynthesis